MSPEELMNFSIYNFDLNKFGDSWDNIKDLVEKLDLDGIELLVNFDNLSDEVPKEIVSAVHLPSFMGWTRLWKDDKFAIPSYITDESVKYFYGGRSISEIVTNFSDCLSHAAASKPAYGVFHATYTEVDSAFSKNHLYSESEVLHANAELLNEVASKFHGNEPPFEIYIENLWYPGLTFLNSDNTLEFMDLLDFKRWKFLLDTGHLMNATGICNNEEMAIDTVIECLDRLDSEIIKKIDGVHLQLSTSGNYQKNVKEPENYSKLCFDEKYSIIINHLKNIDHHHPFSSERCREIVDLVSPGFITHELQAKTALGVEKALSQQITAFRN